VDLTTRKETSGVRGLDRSKLGSLSQLQPTWAYTVSADLSSIAFVAVFLRAALALGRELGRKVILTGRSKAGDLLKAFQCLQPGSIRQLPLNALVREV
jgi:hypothetical protein